MDFQIKYVIFNWHVLKHMQFLDSALNKLLMELDTCAIEEYVIIIKNLIPYVLCMFETSNVLASYMNIPYLM